MIAGLLGLLLVLVICQGLATATTRATPERAVAIAPWNARALSAASTILFGDGSGPRARQQAAVLARKALLRDPTSVGAAATLGLQTQIDRPAAAPAFFSYAEGLSRRELRVQLWQIEHAVERGDIKAALMHYDIALRVTPGAASLLHPVLATAITDPAIRTELIDVFRKRPNWAASFLDGVTVNGPDFPAAARLLLEMRRAGVAVPATAAVNIVGSLVARNELPLAWQMYAQSHPGANRRAVRNGRFADSRFSIPPFDWTFPEESGATATSAGNGGLDVQAPPAVGGTVARQLQYLPPGTYRLVTNAANVAQAAPSRPYWSLSCTGGQSLARLPVRSAGEALGRSSQTFTVPAGCPAQWLTLVVIPADEPEGIAFVVRDVAIVPAA